MRCVRVLVVEDYTDLRHLLDLALSRSEMEVVTAVDGADALEKLDEARPDVIVTDLIMPRLDGLHLVQEVRDRPAYAHVPVLLLTAVPTDARAVELSGLPRTYVMTKPPHLRDLEPVIRDLLKSAE